MPSSSYWQNKAVLLTGASAGLGLVLGQALAQSGARVLAVARGEQRLHEVYHDVETVACFTADVTNASQMHDAVDAAVAAFGKLDAVMACAGRSDRGRVEALRADQARDLLELNFLGAVRTVQPALPHLLASRGHVVLIGSLASKTAGPYLGAYPSSKFPLAAYAQQLRLELGSRGLHTLLVCPGPIARPDAGSRYDGVAADLPPEARMPGGGAKLKGLAPEHVAKAILRACRKRRAELILPAKARFLLLLQQLSPALGDWLVKKMTTNPYPPPS